MDGAEDVEGSGVGCDPVFGGMMRQLITILEQNAIESDKDIYDGLSLKDLAEQVYDELLKVVKSASP